MRSPSRQARRAGVRSRLVALVGSVLLLAGLVPAATVVPVLASHTTAPTSVTVAGSLQSELGCPGDWQPECAATQLAYDATDDGLAGHVRRAAAGSYEYKAALNDTWDENYGANAAFNGANIAPDGRRRRRDVKFYYATPRTGSRATGTRRSRRPPAASRASSAAPATGSPTACARGSRTPTATASTPSSRTTSRPATTSSRSRSTRPGTRPIPADDVAFIGRDRRHRHVHVHGVHQRRRRRRRGRRPARPGRRGPRPPPPARRPDRRGLLLRPARPLRQRRRDQRRGRPDRRPADHRPRPDRQGLLPRRRHRRPARPARLHRGPRHDRDLDGADLQEPARSRAPARTPRPATTATGSPTSPRSTRTSARTPSSRRSSTRPTPAGSRSSSTSSRTTRPT